MFNNSVSPSLADIAAVTNRDNDGWGNGDGWWVLIILFALFGGWGNGWGNNNGSNGTAGLESSLDASLQRGFDNQSVMNKLNGLESGLCSGFYSMNTNLLEGFNGINNTVQQGNFGIQQAINDNTVAGIQSSNALQSQMAQGFCSEQASDAQTRYDMATSTCAIQNAIAQQTNAIMQNDNANYRQMHDELVAIQMNAKDEKIAEQASTIQALNLTASQTAQNQYLVNQLRPAAIPAFTVPNPYSSYGYGCYCNQTTCC